MDYNIKSMESIIDFSKPFLCSVEGYEPQPISEMLEIVDEKKHIVNTRLAQCDNISRNRNFYGLEDVLWSLKNSKYIQECIAQGIWFGELEHPSRDCDLARFMKIDDERISHKIYKYWHENEFLKGTVQFIPPMGDRIWRWITEASVNMAFSLRIYTPNYIKKKDAQGNPYVEKCKPMFPVTFDAVKTPGYENVRIVDPTTFASKNQAYITCGKNSLGVESYCIDVLKDNVSENIKKVLNSTGEEDLNIIGDLFDMDMKKARAIFNAETNQVTMSAEDGTKIAMNVNTYLFNQIMTKGALN